MLIEKYIVMICMHQSLNPVELIYNKNLFSVN